MHVEPGALLRLKELTGQALPNHRLVMIADETVNRLYDEWTSGTTEARRLGARSSDAGMRPKFAARLTCPPGEAGKTRETWQALTDELLSRGIGRDSAVVAIGGGVTGDLAGFVAATYMRGVPLVLVPTTLLAMVDSSVGGKVGVDTRFGKNLVGAFHPPALVVADPLTLVSLPDREYRAGIAEAIKHGVVADREYFEWIVSRGREIRSRQPGIVAELVERSVRIKAGVVGRDERETGPRAMLNAGHTVAHAIEQVSGYQLGHGEAVAIGLVVECRMAETLGIAGEGTALAVAGALERFGLPVRLPESLGAEALIDAMRNDKKNRGGQIRFALARGIGEFHRGGDAWTVAVPPQTVQLALSSPSINIAG